MSQTAKVIVSVLAVLGGISLFAGEGKSGNNNWIGGPSGDFDNPENWEKGVPDSDETLVVNVDYPVSINVPSGVWPVYGLGIGVANNPLETMTTNSVTFVGAGTLVSEGQSNIYSNRWVVFDGVGFTFGNFWERGPVRIEAKNGSRFQDANNVGLTMSDGSTLVFDGVDADISELHFGANTVFEMKGGRLGVHRKSITAGAGFRSLFTGGTIALDASISHASLGAADGGEMIVPQSPAAKLLVTDTRDNSFETSSARSGMVYDVQGLLSVTNGGITIAGTLADSVLATFSGRGDVWVKKLTVNAQYLSGGRFTYQDFDVSGLNLGSKLYAGAASFANRLTLWGETRLGVWGDVVSERNMTMESVGDLTIDTSDCFDKTASAHDVALSSVALCPRDGANLSVVGGGSFSACIKDRHQRWNGFFLGENTTFAVADSDAYAIGGYRPQLKVRTLNLGPGSVLRVTGYTGAIDARKIGEIDPTAKIVATLPSCAYPGMFVPILTTDDLNADLSEISVEFTPPVGTTWAVRRSSGVIYLRDETPDAPKMPPAADLIEWTGNSGCAWSDTGNWSGGVVPGWMSATNLVFSGTKNPDIVNDTQKLSVKVKQLRFMSGGPFRLSGAALYVDGTGAGGWTGSTVESENNLPVIIDCGLSHGAAATSGLGITAYSNSYIRINGDVTASDNLTVAGDVRFGGNVSCNRFTPVQNRGWDSSSKRGTEGRNTQMTLLPGAKFEVRSMSQDMSCPNAFDLDVESGATYLISGGTRYYWTSYPHDYFVNGIFDCRIPLGGTTTMDISGTGTVYLASTISTGGDCDVYLGGGIRVIPASWQTVTDSANPGKRIRPVITTWATFGATNDWTYGVADGVTPTTEPAARAINLMRPLSTLTVDTADPMTGIGHSVTFADPVAGHGKLVKDGVGTLVLASMGNDIRGGVTVKGGSLAWTAPQLIGKLAAEKGTALKFGLVDGEPVKLTVASDLDLDGVGLAPFGDTGDFTKWVTVIETTGDAKIVGAPIVPDEVKCRVVGNRLQLKTKMGMCLTVR